MYLFWSFCARTQKNAAPILRFHASSHKAVIWSFCVYKQNFTHSKLSLLILVLLWTYAEKLHTAVTVIYGFAHIHTLKVFGFSADIPAALILICANLAVTEFLIHRFSKFG